MISRKLLASAVLACVAMVVAPQGRAERVGDIASFQGVRENALIGYGLVVGLDGSGDQTTQAPFTVQGVVSMLQQLGVNVPSGGSLQLKNVAAVMVTSSLPAFSRPGQAIDITASSLGNAKSLKGGTLLMTPLKGADGQIYAMAQGNLIVSSAGSSGGGGRGQANHLAAGRIPGGATVERSVRMDVGQDGVVDVELTTASFTTASRVVVAINDKFGANTAAAIDGRVIRVTLPKEADKRVAFLGALESLEVAPGKVPAKVIINARTGSVVMNQAVTLDPCAVSHGGLSVVVSAGPPALIDSGLPGGTASVTTQVELKMDPDKLVYVRGGALLSDVTKALNAIGVTPQDLLAILQAMKSAGALRAELEVI